MRFTQECLGFSGVASGKEPACQCRGRKKSRFNPLVGKISWRRAWQPTCHVFLPGESHRGACQATARRVTKSFRIQLKQLSTQRFFSLGFTANLRGMYRDFSHASCSLEGMTSPTINIPYHSGELVTTNDTSLTYH